MMVARTIGRSDWVRPVRAQADDVFLATGGSSSASILVCFVAAAATFVPRHVDQLPRPHRPEHGRGCVQRQAGSRP